MFNRKRHNRRTSPLRLQNATRLTRAMPDPHCSGASVTHGVRSDGLSLNTYQQDRHVVQTFQCSEPGKTETQMVHVLAVADGHGLREDGHVVSSFIMADLCGMLKQYRCLPPPEEDVQQGQPHPIPVTTEFGERLSSVHERNEVDGGQNEVGNTNRNDNTSGIDYRMTERSDSGKNENDVDVDKNDIDKNNANDDDDNNNSHNENDNDNIPDAHHDNASTESQAQRNFRDAFLALDATSIRACQRFHKSCHAGSTLSLAIHNDTTNTIHIANVGDSYCFILSHPPPEPHSSSSSSSPYTRVRTTPHVFTNPIERQRVEAAGGVFDESGRVLGHISMTRALGDDDLKGERNRTVFRVPGRSPYKDTLFIAEPDVMAVNVEEGDFALLLVSDGVSDYVDEETVLELVGMAFVSGRSASFAAKMITDRVQRVGGRDNATAVVHWLRSGRGDGKKKGMQQQQQLYSSGFLSINRGQHAKTARDGREQIVLGHGRTTEQGQNRVDSTRLVSEPRSGRRQRSDSEAAGQTSGLFKWLCRR